MRVGNWVKPLIAVCLGVTGALSPRAQGADSLKRRLAALQGQFQARRLKDTDYLRSVDSIAPLLEGDDSLPVLLSTYRQIAFDDRGQVRRRANYYTYLALNAYNANKFGAAIYYAEKNNEEKVRSGLFGKGELAHSDLFALSLYYNNHGYTKVIGKLHALAPALARIPETIAAGKATPEQVFLALSMLQTAVYTYAKTGDTGARETASRLADTIQQRLRRQPGTYAPFMSRFDYLQHSTAYRNEQLLGHTGQALALLQAAIRDVQSPDFPRNLKADYSASLYTEAVEFFFQLNRPDSACHYLAILQQHGENAPFAVTDPGFLLTSEGRLLAGQGRYREAYDTLQKAWLFRDSAFYAVSSDRDNNLYALAEAENARAELFRSEESKRAARQSNLLLFLALTLMVLGGVSTFLIYRGRQQQRLFALQSHLAGNFHDTVGPMLLYANALVKKESDRHPSKGLDELKSQIGQIMQAVRGISHDLKSNRLDTVASLGRELSSLLEKLRETTGIAFTLTVDNGNPILSNFQKAHLSRIIHELITNSVRHASCNNITIALKGLARILQIDYSDDGRGIDPAAATSGIGMENIRERVTALQGRMELNNNFPNGYSISLSIPLL
jgi:signal transduction histidine kinase